MAQQSADVIIRHQAKKDSRPPLHHSITPSLHHSITPALQHSSTPALLAPES
jgi:hypothetical protein